jgi:hypothetical protein
VKNLSSQENAESRIRSVVWDFLHSNQWNENDDFSLELSNKLFKILTQSALSTESLLNAINSIKTSFFRINKVTKKEFAKLLISDLSQRLLTIVSEKREPESARAPMTIKILFLSANPKETVSLRLDEEIREIEQKIMLAQKKDQLLLVKKGAVRTSDLQLYLNQERPSIVHFSGHGTNEGQIVLEDSLGNPIVVPPNALARVFKVLKDNIRCVVLNACFSYEQALAISKYIDCVIGMSSSISDEAAIAFSAAFYLGLASERSIKNAFDQGITEIMLYGIPEENIPKLISRKNINPSKIFVL